MQGCSWVAEMGLIFTNNASQITFAYQMAVSLDQSSIYLITSFPILLRQMHYIIKRSKSLCFKLCGI